MVNRGTRFFVLIGCCLMWVAAVSFSAVPTALEIVKKSDQALRGKTLQGKALMTVRTPEWERTLQMNFWQVNPDKTFIRITAPAKEAGTGTLRIGTNMWMYLPQVERNIKIPPSLMLQSWMGSDFTNDDLVKESSLPTDYTHRLDGEVTVDGDPCYRIISTPKPDAPVVWGKLVLAIRKSDDLPRKEEFYSDKDKLQKVLTYDDIRSVDGRPYPLLWKMVSINKAGHETTLQFQKLEFDCPIPNRIYTQENLKQRF